MIYSKYFTVFLRNKHRSILQYSTQNPPWSLLFFGADNFSLISLKTLNLTYRNKTLLKCLEVVTTPKNNIIRKYALENSLKVYNWPLDEDVLNITKYDIGVVVSFGHLIPQDLINSFPMGILNIHASLLPRWRGAAPIIYALANGDETTGISIMRIKPEKFDIGDIVIQKEIKIDKDITMPELHDRLANLGAECLNDLLGELPDILNTSKPQSQNGTTFAPRVHPKMAIINFAEQTALRIYNLSRALTGLYPLTTKWNDTQIKLYDIKIWNHAVRSNMEKDELSPGSVYYNKEYKVICIKCGKDTWISVNKIGVSGKKVMTAIEFANGYLNKVKINSRIFR